MNFYDTNALLKMNEEIFNEHFVISSTSLYELESIKTNKHKDEEVRYDARRITRLLDKYSYKYDVIVFTEKIAEILHEYKVFDTPDNEIIACAKYASKMQEIIFVSDDICCKNIARQIFNLDVKSVGDNDDDLYTGFIEKTLNETEMAYFYSHLTQNQFNLLDNQYLVLKNDEGEIVDKLKWHNGEHQTISIPTVKSNYFGSVKAYKNDVYQQMVLNSLSTNQITMIKGDAGTGKSYLAIGYMLHLLEKHKIDKIVIFANPQPTKNAAKIGFLPGNQFSKLEDSSCGNMLSAKLGGKYAIEQLSFQNKLEILPMCDIRGYDTSGMNCAVYITEAQNMDIALMKLALQRVGEDSICIIDGDYFTQTDLSQYEGNNNGMRRMSEVFRGKDFYGEVELQNIYRSKIALVANEM